jgi:hypothetical protein
MREEDRVLPTEFADVLFERFCAATREGNSVVLPFGPAFSARPKSGPSVGPRATAEV